jgi:hypothetical protein
MRMKLPAALSKTLPKALVPGLKHKLTGLRGRSGRQSSALRHQLATALVAGEPLDKDLLARLDQQLILPSADETDEETSRAAVQDYGQFLVRQDRWEDLSALIHEVDQSRRATACAMSHAELLCFGARADVVQAAEDAMLDGTNPALDGIEALEEVLEEFPGDYAIAVVVALAHIDFGWAWRGGDWPHEIPERNLRLFEAHFDRAATILDDFADIVPDAPLLAAARCALLAGRPLPAKRLADEYEALITLDPINPRPMRALGHHLLPRWHGSYDLLELEARRTAARTTQTWGNGGYTWVFWDALAIDPGAARVVDLDFFVDGMRDILSQGADQYYANLMAAYAAITMSPDSLPDTAPDITRDLRTRLHGTLDWVLSEYLYELHPLVWAQAAIGHDARSPLPMRNTLVRRGLITARRTIARHFADEILNGTTIAFSPHGLRFYEPN